MKQYLLTLELRYTDYKNGDTQHKEVVETFGVYDDVEDAYKAGNKFLEYLESRYKLHVFPSGVEAKRERFSKNGAPFGRPNHLVTNLAYLKTPFEFYFKITTLNYGGRELVLDEAEAARKRYIEYRNSD